MSPVPGYKVVLLGDASVGKSAIVTRFVQNKFHEHSEATVGAAFAASSVALENGDSVKFEIWDTAGQERFRSLAPMYYRGATCAIVVYDVSCEGTFQRAKEWVKELQNNVDFPEYLVVALCANKIDLQNECGDAPINYAREETLLYAETSAKSGLGVRNLFEELARTVPDMARRREAAKREMDRSPKRTLNLRTEDDLEPRKAGCCG